MSKLQFNGFLFSWWLCNHCLCLVLWRFYLFPVMFLVYLSQGLHVPFFYTYLTLWRFFWGESSWIVHGTCCVQWCQMTPSYLLCYLVDVQCNVPILFSLICRYICYCMINPTGTQQDDYKVVASVCFDIGWFVNSCQM